MKLKKKVLSVIIAATAVLSLSVTAMAADNGDNDITQRERFQGLVAQRQACAQVRCLSLEEMQALLEQKVEDGKLTKEQVASILERIQARKAACDAQGDCPLDGSGNKNALGGNSLGNGPQADCDGDRPLDGSGNKNALGSNGVGNGPQADCNAQGERLQDGSGNQNGFCANGLDNGLQTDCDGDRPLDGSGNKNALGGNGLANGTQSDCNGDRPQDGSGNQSCFGGNGLSIDECLNNAQVSFQVKGFTCQLTK